MKKLYKFYWDCGRMGDIEGIFVAGESEVKTALGKRVYLGEALGKHSEVFGDLEEKDVKILTEDQDFIIKFEQLIGLSGYNPLDYLPETRE